MWPDMSEPHGREAPMGTIGPHASPSPFLLMTSDLCSTWRGDPEPPAVLGLSRGGGGLGLCSGAPGTVQGGPGPAFRTLTCILHRVARGTPVSGLAPWL